MAVRNSPTINESDVSATIALCSDGDTVLVPPGTATYASQLDIAKNISIIGAGTAQSIIKSDLDTVFNVTVQNNSSLFRLSGFTFQKVNTRPIGTSTGFIQISGQSPVPNFRIDHIWCNDLYTQNINFNGGLWGVVDHCQFDTTQFKGCLYPNHQTWKGVGGFGDNSWADDPLFGTEKFIFVEDCTFANFDAATMVDIVNGGRVTLRNSTISLANAGNHGTETTGRARGGRVMEVYNNQFLGEYPAVSGHPQNYSFTAVYLRSGTAVIHHNIVRYYNSIVHFANYREWFAPSPWGGANGVNAWDSNSATIFASGTATGGASKLLQDSGAAWTTDQWRGYTLRNLTTGTFADILTNTATSISTNANTQGASISFSAGQSYEIRKVLIVLDQPCRGKGDLISGSSPSPVAWPNQALEPVYIWSNTWTDRQNGTPAVAPDNAGIWALNTDYFYSGDASAAKPGYTQYTYPHPLVLNYVYLSTLVFSAGTLSPAFLGTSNQSYSFTTIATTTNITATWSPVTAVVNANATQLLSGVTSGEFTLAFGANVFNITTRGADGTINTYTVTVNKTSGANANLSALTVSNGALSPAFASATTAYAVAVGNGVSSITFTPTLSDTNASVKVNGVTVTSGMASQSIPLSVGSNTVNIVVTAQDGTTTKTYTITVTRAASANADLSAFTVSTGSFAPAFGANITSYAETVPNATASMTVTPTVADSTATVKVNGVTVTSGSPSGSIALSVGNTVITTVVTAQNGSTKSYVLTVHRIANNANISSLTISVGTLTPAFASGTTSYTDSVPSGTTSCTVTPTLTGPSATVRLNGGTVNSGGVPLFAPLVTGPNTLSLLVTAEDGTTTKTYTIVVTVALSSNANLASLSTTAGSLVPAFAAGTTSYAVSTGNATATCTVTPTVADSGASVKVNGVAVTSGQASGAITLNVGSNAISVVVTAADGSTKTYTITVTRAAPSSDATLSALTATAGALVPVFSPNTTSYTIAVTNATTTTTVRPTVTTSGATIKVNGTTVASGQSSPAINLNVGTNTINVVVTALDGVTTKTYSIVITRAASSNANLSALTSSAGALSPAFAQNTTSYAQNVLNNVSTMTVTPTVAQANATIKVNGVTVASGTASGAIALSVGSNAVNIVVTAQDGTTTKTYTIVVTRAASGNANLSSLALSAGSLAPAFAQAVTSYTASVGAASSSITVTPTVAQANATVKVNGIAVTSGQASGAIALNFGQNTITATVTAQNGTLKTYTVVVTRISNVATLSNLVVTTAVLAPAFASNVTAYTSSVPNSIASVTVTPTVTSGVSTVTVNAASVASGQASAPIAMSVGANIITVTVTAQDGTTADTTITITRAGIALSTNANLSDLVSSIGAISPAFSAGNLNYTQNTPYTTVSFFVTPTVEDSTATVSVSGTPTASGSPGPITLLATGINYCFVVVTAEDGATQKQYVLAITKAAPPSNNADLAALSTSAGVLAPPFDPATTGYFTEVLYAVATASVNATLADSHSTMTINGSPAQSGVTVGGIALAVGTNDISIVVTAEDTTTKTYTLEITRLPSSENANLFNIELSGGTLIPPFTPDTLDYEVFVQGNVSQGFITVTTADSTATILINGSPATSGKAFGPVTFQIGENLNNFVITAQDGTTVKTYTLTVNRAAPDPIFFRTQPGQN